jgi:1-phosphofructokinase
VIVTVTPNPSIDRTLQIASLARGGVQRASATSSDAGGKGINVARALASEGHQTLAIVPLAAASASLFRSLLGTATPIEVVPISGEVRMNVSLVEPDGIVTKVNEPGPRLGDDEVEALLQRAALLAARGTWIAGCGSLPPGVPADFYARLAGRVLGSVSVAVDADGAALRACLGQPLSLIKPNLPELVELAGRPLPTIGDVVAAGGRIVSGGVRAVLVSLGPDGAVLVDSEGAIHAEARLDQVANPVGAGDALLAGFLAGGANRAALRVAVAWSLAACRAPGTQMLPMAQADLDAVSVHLQPASERLLAA